MKEKKIGVLGLAFKANTDDIRFSPAIEVIGRLLGEGARISATDPQAIERTRSLFPDILYAADPYETAKGAEALLILTEWPEFRALDWKRIHGLMMRPLVLDGRNLLDPAKMADLGFEYYSFGRPDDSSDYSALTAAPAARFFHRKRRTSELLTNTSSRSTAFNVLDIPVVRFRI